jgi:cob(I)alamin adenosyltransferase
LSKNTGDGRGLTLSSEKSVVTKGLTLVFTGNGKGKTTAALGMALRAWGQGLKVMILQFIKGGWQCGELIATQKLEPNFVMRQMGAGFVKGAKNEGLEVHRAAAQNALAEARIAVRERAFDMIVLDEINCAVHFNLVNVDDVLDIIRTKPADLHLVLTGRNAANEVVELADLVTDMREIKHPFTVGMPAQKGIEF